MDYKQIVDILENQPYYVKNGNQTLILKKPVVVKTFDNNNISLSILRINEDRKVYTDTPQFQWQTYQFTKQYRIHKIEGKLYCNDNRYYDYECQFLNLDQQWISIIKQQGAHKDLSIEFKPKLWALGIRFQGINTRNDIFHLNKLNIFAKVGLPEAQEGVKVSLLHLPLNYDKRQIVNLLERQVVYKKINNHYLGTKQYVAKIFDESKWSIQDIVDNDQKNLYSRNWITFEFSRKFKVKSIIAIAFDGKSTYNYELQLLNKQKEWLKMEQVNNKQGDIQMEFIPTISSLGIRIKGSQDDQNGISIRRITILAEQGSPILEQ